MVPNRLPSTGLKTNLKEQNLDTKAQQDLDTKAKQQDLKRKEDWNNYIIAETEKKLKYYKEEHQSRQIIMQHLKKQSTQGM